MTAGPRLNEMVREAWRNLGPRQLMWATATTVLATLAAVWIGAAATAAIAAERDLRSAGSLVWVAQRPKGATIDGAQCERFNAATGVAASGGGVAGLPPPPTLTAFPAGRPISVFYVTPRAVEVFLPTAAPGVTYIGADLQATHQATVGTWLFAGPRPAIRISDALPPGVPVPEIGSAVTVPVAGNTPLRQCWIRVKPGGSEAAADLLRFQFRERDIQIGPLLPRDGLGPTPREQWSAAASTQPWWFAAALAAGIASLLAFTRRSELAVYRTFGATRSHLSILIGIEYALVSIPGLFASWLGTLTIANLNDWNGSATVQWLMARCIISAFVGSWALSVALSGLALLGSIPEHLKDR